MASHFFFSGHVAILMIGVMKLLSSKLTATCQFAKSSNYNNVIVCHLDLKNETFSLLFWWTNDVSYSLKKCTQGSYQPTAQEQNKSSGWGSIGSLCTICSLPCDGEVLVPHKILKAYTFFFLFGVWKEISKWGLLTVTLICVLFSAKGVFFLLSSLFGNAVLRQ